MQMDIPPPETTVPVGHPLNCPPSTEQDMQMDIPHPESNLPTQPPPYCPPPAPPGIHWMPMLPPSLNCPPGLEYLSQIDLALVHQRIELLEILIGIETNNKYEIKNRLGQKVYLAVEDTNILIQNFCGKYRPFTLRILDNLGREVITMERPLRCNLCCFPCCLQEVKIQAPPGVPIGYVIQKWDLFKQKFTVQNEERKDILKIVGICVTWTFCSDIDFKITSLDEKSVVGKISKHWAGFIREIFTDADNFGTQFPADLDVKMKAVMLGACFLIDFIYFEKKNCGCLFKWI
ncbi:phospholipid scramblase 1 [Fukomys damarensis]|uniref:phospholipid scramblase 1 n=1 Tax=Fukomys damarensis TaxID=885580 RepID=UPI0005400D15|nr:phospholipid scramblase 1 [Fukomys damarensis]